MVIIIEGIDRVGKTTLANKLHKKLRIPIYKKFRTCEKVNTYSEEEKELINYGDSLGAVNFWNSDSFKGDIIVDRFHWTEYVYTKVDRDVSLSRKYLSNIEKLMSQRKEKYVIIYVKPVDVKYCSKLHGSDLTLHNDLFDNVYIKSNFENILVMDYIDITSKNNFRALTKVIKNMKKNEIKKRKERTNLMYER